jgi:hypothetical protein
MLPSCWQHSAIFALSKVCLYEVSQAGVALHLVLSLLHCGHSGALRLQICILGIVDHNPQGALHTPGTKLCAWSHVPHLGLLQQPPAVVYNVRCCCCCLPC